jgi:hypothetical protein
MRSSLTSSTRITAIDPSRGARPWLLAVQVVLTVLLGCHSAWAQATRWPRQQYAVDSPSLVETIDALKVESAVTVVLVTYAGLKAWGWGTRSFTVGNEGWFGMDTPHGGADKVGHLYNTYVLSEAFYLRLSDYYGKRRVVSVYPALLGLTIMTYIEVADGFSVDHGFSPEDFIMDAAGAAFSSIRNALPEVGYVFDLRFEYLPSRSVRGLHPFKDYSGQKFLGVLKLAGLGPLYDTPLRYVELLVGYSARGFKNLDAGHYTQKTSEVFCGVGLSVQQLLLGRLERQVGTPFDYIRAASDYFQVPYSYVPVTLSERTAPRTPR